MPLVRNQLYIAMSLVMSGAWEHNAAAATEVEVHVPATTGVIHPRQMLQAQSIASRIYRQAGISLRWRHSGEGSLDCSRRERRVVLRYSTRTPADSHPGAFGFATPYSAAGSCVTLFIDRVEVLAERNPNAAVHLLGHILAHEIGHYLQGIERHSESGVMKGSWTVRETRLMSSQHLQFTEHDVRLFEMVLGPLSGQDALSRAVPPLSKRKRQRKADSPLAAFD